MTQFLVTSAILTIVLNLVIRLPGVRPAISRWLTSMSSAAHRRDESPGDEPRMRIFFPWKAMLIASVVLTVLLNLANLAF